MDNLSPEFVKGVIQSLWEFVNDDLRATLLMTHFTLEESKFIIRIASINNVTKVNYDLTKDMIDLLEKIIEIKSSQNTWKLRLATKIIVINRTRNITIEKIPNFDDTDKHERASQPKTNGEIEKQEETKKEKRKRKIKLSKNKAHENGNKSTETLDTGNTPERPMYTSTTSRNKIVMVAEQKTRLLEGLSEPVAGKGLRMMQIMGWDGGALGLRGEGITEPIMPELDIVESGKKKAKTKTDKTIKKPTISNVYLTVVKHIYNQLIEMQMTETVIEMPSSDNEKKYIKSLVNCLNLRSEMSLKKYLRTIFAMIKTEMIKDENKDCVLHVQFNKNEIKLSKTKLSPNLYKRTVVNTENTKPESNQSKDANWLAFKIAVLNKVTDFLDNDRSKEEVELDQAVTGRHSSFLDQVVAAVKKKQKVRVPDDAESDAWNLLLSKINTNYLLDVVYQQSFKKLILRKEPILIVHKKVLTNVSKEINDNCDVKTGNVKNKYIIKPRSVQSNNGETKTENIVNNTLTKEIKIGNNINNTLTKKIKTEMKLNNTLTKETKTENNLNNTLTKETKTENNLNSTLTKEIKTEINLSNTLTKEIITGNNLNNTLTKEIKTENNLSNTLTKDMKTENNLNNTLKKEIKSENNLQNTKTIKKEIVEAHLDGHAKIDKALTNRVPPKTDNLGVDSKNNEKQTICVVFKTYPDDPIDNDTVVAFQYLISHVIRSLTDWLPLLECHGVNNGALVYTCYNDQTFYWFCHLVKDACNKVKIISSNNIFEETAVRAVSMKINSFVNEDVLLILERLQKYNKELDVSKWVVTDRNFLDTYLLFIIEIDKISLDYISRRDFSLFCGHDKAKFSIIWD